jgi:hypothetical protein
VVIIDDIAGLITYFILLQIADSYDSFLEHFCSHYTFQEHAWSSSELFWDSGRWLSNA